MDPRNPAFMSKVKHQRNLFVELMQRMDMLHQIYPSKHFFERVVERNLEAIDIGYMLVPVIRDFRGSTYNARSYCVKWKQFRLFAQITLGPVSGKRQLTLKTIYDKDVEEKDFDVVISI